MSGDKSLAAQRTKQKKLYKMRILLFGCRKDWPKTTQSGDSLVCTPKASQIVDVSSSGSDIDRIPAGGSSKCSCPVKISNQSVTSREMSTQTDDIETISKTEIELSTQSLGDRRDEATQSSFSELPSSSRAVVQVEYSNISRKFEPPGRIVDLEVEPQTGKASIPEKLSQQWSFKNLSSISGAQPPDNRGQPQRQQANRNQTTRYPPPRNEPRYEPPRNQSPRIQPTLTEPSRNPQARSKEPSRYQDPFTEPSRRQPTRSDEYTVSEPTRIQSAKQPKKPVQKKSEVGFQTAYQEKQPTYAENSTYSYSATDQDWQPQSERKPTQSKGQEKPCACQTQCKKQEKPCACQTKCKEQEKPCTCQTQCKEQEKPPPSVPCNRIPELLDRVCKLETKLRCQECKWCPNEPPKKCGSPCCPNEPQKKSESPCCPKEKPKKCGSPCKPTPKPDCEALKKEFINIFVKPKCNQKNSSKQINICPSKDTCEESRKMFIQCVADSEMLMQQFNQMFLKPKCPPSNCCIKKPACPEPCPKNPCQVKQCPEPEPNPCCPKPKPKPCCCPEPEPNPCCPEPEPKPCCPEPEPKPCCPEPEPNPCCCPEPEPNMCMCMKKEVYESLLNQFTKCLTKSKMGSGQQGEPYSFERLCSELACLFKKQNLLSPVNDENQKVCCSCKSTNEPKEKPCQDPPVPPDCCICKKSTNEPKPCKDPPVPPCCCGKKKDPPVLCSLVDTLMNLIGCRLFRDVVLTIKRQGCNVYNLIVRELATGNVLGCFLANGMAINEAIRLGLFEDIHTFCELEKENEDVCKDCPQRVSGGETQMSSSDKERHMEFVTRVLGLPAGESQRFFSLTNALKSAKKSSDQNLVRTKSSEVTEYAGHIGLGPVTGNLIFLGSVHDDLSELGEASKHFLRLLSGLDVEDTRKD